MTGLEGNPLKESPETRPWTVGATHKAERDTPNLREQSGQIRGPPSVPVQALSGANILICVATSFDTNHDQVTPITFALSLLIVARHDGREGRRLTPPKHAHRQLEQSRSCHAGPLLLGRPRFVRLAVCSNATCLISGRLPNVVPACPTETRTHTVLR